LGTLQLRLTLQFAITSAAVFAAAGVVVCYAFCRLATDNVVLAAERETERTLSHLVAETAERVRDPVDGSVTLESLANPEALPLTFARATGALGFVGADLYAPDGTAVWTTDPSPGGTGSNEPPTVIVANVGRSTSWPSDTPEFVEVGTGPRSLDAVSSYVPVRSSANGPVIGLLRGYRDVSGDLSGQVAQSRAAVVRATAATLGGLFTALLGFVFVADRAQTRARRTDLEEEKERRVRAEERGEVLAASEVRARQAIEAAADGAITVDAAGIVTGWTPRTEAVLGWSGREALGRPLGEVMSVPSDGIERLRRAGLEPRTNGNGAASPARVEAEGLHRDGRRVLIELWVAALSVDGDASLTLFLHDVTERRRVEEDLRQTAADGAALAEIARIASRSPDIDDVFGRFAKRTGELIPADRIVLSIVDQNNETITAAHVMGLDVPGLERGVAVPLHGNPVLDNLRNGSAVLLNAVAMQARGAHDRATAADFAAGIRSELVAAVRNGDKTVASLVLASTRPDAYTPRHAVLAERVAAQISGTVANAGLYAALQRDAAENSALAEIGRVAGSSADPEAAYQRAAELLSELVPADRVVVESVDRARGTRVLLHAEGVDVPGRKQAGPKPMDGAMAGVITETGKHELVSLSSASDAVNRFADLAPAYRAGLRTFLALPLAYHHEVVGTLHLQSKTPDAYSARQVELAGQVAALMSGTVAESALREGIGREMVEQAVLAEIGRLVSSSPALEEMCGLVARPVGRLVAFDWISVSTLDLASGTAHHAGIAGRDVPERASAGPIHLAGTTSETVARARAGLALGRESPETLESRFPGVARFVGGAARSSVSAPLIMGEDAIGALHLMSAEADAYSAADVRMVERIALQVAGAVGTAGVHREATRHAEERVVLAEITRVVSSSLEVEESLEQLASRLEELFAFDTLAVSTVDTQKGTLRDRHVTGREGTRFDWGVDEPLEGTLIQRAVVGRAGFIARVDSEEFVARGFAGNRDAFAAGARSILAVPLVFNEAVVGALELRSDAADSFSESDVSRAERVAAQIAGAVASTQLHASLARDAAEREALAEMGRIVSSTLDVNAVYDELAGQIRRLVPFDRFGVYLAGKDRHTLKARYVTGAEADGPHEGATFTLGPDAIDQLFPGKLGRIFDGEPSPSFSQIAGGPSTATGNGLPSAMAVPLVSNDVVIGLMELHSRAADAYSEQDLALAERVGAQIAGALSNALLHGRIQRESEERAVLAEISRIISSSADIGEVYERFAEQVRRLVPFDGIAISTLDAGGQTITNAYLTGVDAGGMAPGVACPASETVAGRVAQSGKSRLVRVREERGSGSGSEDGPAIGDSGLIIPLAFEGRPVGSLSLSAQGRDLYTEHDLALAEQVAVQIAGAVGQWQLHAELRLRSAALEAAADMILITDRDGTIEYANEAFTRHTGYSHEEVVGQNPRFLISGHQDPEFYERLWSRILAGDVWDGRWTAQRKDGSEYPEEMIITPVREADGEIVRFIAIKRDVTERVRAEQERESLRQLDAENRELQRVNEARSQFLSTVSHELRTPLTSMIAFADILARDRWGNLRPRQTEQLEIIQRNGERLQLLISDLLDVSRIDSGRFTLEEAEFDARLLLDEIVSNFEPILSDKWQRMETSVPDGPVWMHGDHDRLLQVISNLLSNASKYSADGATIELAARTDGNWLRMEVRDYGIGISRADLRKLYIPFFRADNEETREVSGTGLGLLIAKSIVELHDGSMSVESERGVGTTVRVSVPRVVERPREA